jgi:hypothetical protein
MRLGCTPKSPAHVALTPAETDRIVFARKGRASGAYANNPRWLNGMLSVWKLKSEGKGCPSGGSQTPFTCSCGRGRVRCEKLMRSIRALEGDRISKGNSDAFTRLVVYDSVRYAGVRVPRRVELNVAVKLG